MEKPSVKKAAFHWGAGKLSFGGRPARERPAKGAARWCLRALWFLPAPLLLLYVAFSSRKELAQTVAERVARPVRSILGAVSAWFPFSVMELLYTLLGFGIAAYLVFSVVKLVKSEKKGQTAFRLAKWVLLPALYILCGCLWFWGIEYQAYTFAEKENYQPSLVSAKELGQAAEYFLESAVRLEDSVKRDGEGRFRADMDVYFQQAGQVYDQLERRFPSLSAPSRIPKKMKLYSGVMSHMGFSGVYFCFTGESNINIDQPQAFIPFTIAHELAHQKSVASEQECNFLGIAAGITSGIPEYQYSCYLAGAVHLMNALYKADREQWQEVWALASGPVRADLAENDAYWHKKETPVTNVSKKAYDVYLKANGQKLGVESYGACVDLLVEFCRREGVLTQ